MQMIFKTHSIQVFLVPNNYLSPVYMFTSWLILNTHKHFLNLKKCIFMYYISEIALE